MGVLFAIGVAILGAIVGAAFVISSRHARMLFGLRRESWGWQSDAIVCLLAVMIGITLGFALMLDQDRRNLAACNREYSEPCIIRAVPASVFESAK